MVSATTPSTSAILDPAFVSAFRSGTLTREQAAAFADQPPGVIQFQMMQLSATVADGSGPGSGPHTPSGAVPPYQKPAADPKKRRGKSGARPGHPGSSRPPPGRIDRRVEHQLPACPDCGGALRRTGRKRTRVIEDIPPDLTKDVAAHTAHRDWCPHCKKQVEPKVPDALPQCTLGNRAVALTHLLAEGSMNSVIRKFTRNRKQYPNAESAVKLVYLAIHEASKRWTTPIVSWKAALNHFAIVFEGRMPRNLEM